MDELTEREKLAWCAGFLDGEGTFGTYTSKGEKPRFRIQAVQVDPAPLFRLRDRLGGAVRGPYGPYSGNRKAYYSWAVHADTAVISTNQLMPFLSSQKKDQAQEALRRIV